MPCQFIMQWIWCFSEQPSDFSISRYGWSIKKLTSQKRCLWSLSRGLCAIYYITVMIISEPARCSQIMLLLPPGSFYPKPRGLGLLAAAQCWETPWGSGASTGTSSREQDIHRWHCTGYTCKKLQGQIPTSRQHRKIPPTFHLNFLLNPKIGLWPWNTEIYIPCKALIYLAINSGLSSYPYPISKPLFKSHNHKLPRGFGGISSRV